MAREEAVLITPLGQAFVWAANARGDQKYGDRPYVAHVTAVSAVLSDWGFTGEGTYELHAGALLHDVIEDTSVSLEDVRLAFSDQVADIVWACTGQGDTRDARMADIYAKVAKNGRAALVKLADRIANLEACEPGSDHATRYAREHQAFSAALKPYVPSLCWDRYVTAVSRVMGEACQ